mgnify:CR=1 FL=1
MDIDKSILVNIVLLIHMALTGIMLFRLFKLKNATVGELIMTFVGLMVPVLGPSALIIYFTYQIKKKEQDEHTPTSKKRF